MTNLLLKGAVFATLLGVSVACSDGYTPYKPTSPNKGSMTLKVDLDKSLVNGRDSRAEYSDVTTDDLSLSLSANEGDFEESWDNLSDFPEEKEIPVGEYTVEVSYGDPEEEGFEAPYFYGSQTIQIAENEMTEVNITASLQKAMLSIEYSDEFKDYMTSWKAEAIGAGGTVTVVEADEERPVYVQEGSVSVNVEFTKPNGKGGKLEVASFVAKPRRVYHVKVGLDEGYGDAALAVTIDESLAEETILIDISDEILAAPAPEVKAANFDDSQPFVFIPGFVDGVEAKVNIMARGGLKSVNIHTTGTSLLDQQWPENVELMSADASVKAKLDELGLETRGVYNNPDKLAVLDFGGVLDHIIYMSNGDNLTMFTITAKDRYGKVSDPFTVTFDAQRPVLELLSGSAYVGGEEVTVDFNFNAGNVDALKFEYYNNALGIWSTADATITSLHNNPNVDYRATLTIYGESDLKVRATAGRTTSNELDIERTPQVVAKGDVNAFAKKAYIPVTIGDKDNDAALVAKLMAGAQVYVLREGLTNYTQVKTTPMADKFVLEVTGLRAATNYTAKIRNGATDLSDVAEFKFTTESTDDIENGNLGEAPDPMDSQSHWQLFDFDGGWGTNNHMTTSQGGNYGYTRISGTIPSSDATDGYAFLLRTCGWGSGNTAFGNTGLSGLCKYTDPGLLHLGANRYSRPDGYGDNDNVVEYSYRAILVNVNATSSPGPVTTDDLDCGISFKSRPSTLNFQYKYFPKNPNDRGYVEIWVKDAAGNIISKQTDLLIPTSDYTSKKLTLTYPVDAAKAQKLYIKFLSSYNMDFIKLSNDNFSGPGAANTTNGTYMGSQLYLDEISLGY